MSGTTIIASTLPVSVLCTGTTHAEGVDPYSIAIVGERDPGSIHGTGITYDVDTTAFNEWIGLNAGLVDSVWPVTQAEVDDMQDAQDQYGFELGLVEEGGTLAATARMTLAEARAAATTAAQQVRQADQQIHAAEIQRKMADQQTGAAQAAREVAEKAQQAALAVVEEKAQARPLPTREPEPPRAEQHPA
jgi:hypothetical protein